VTGRKFFDREGRLDPENVDRAVNPLVVHERNGNGGQAVVDGWASMMTAEERRIARAVTPRARLGENLVQSFRISRKPIIGCVRFAQPL
jgi:hypothetical protein